MILDMLFMLEIGQVAGADLSSPGFLINGVTDTDLKAAGNWPWLKERLRLKIEGEIGQHCD